MSTATVLRADARALPLPDASVDLVVTSPPYWAQRSYQDGGEHYDGQIGAEPTPAEYIANLIDCTSEWMRVLKPTGSIFVNLGDKMQGKSLLNLPERYRVACVDQLGLIQRAVIIWSKPNGLPESVTDRTRRSHEDWVHLTKMPRYFSAVDEIREAHVKAHAGRLSEGRAFNAIRNGDRNDNPSHLDGNQLGKLPGSVWEIPTEPLIVPDHLGIDHFAAFPTEWPRRIILGWSPSGWCTACGEPRRPVAGRELTADRGGRKANVRPTGVHYDTTTTLGRERVVTLTGYACACPDTSAPTRPAVVVDPFGGTGTVALVAKALGRHGVSVDMSADYCRLATWRTTDPGQLAKAMRVEKPPVQADGQADLFADLFGGAA